MKKLRQPKEIGDTSARKRGKVRLTIGGILIALVAAFTLIVTVTMRQRIEAADAAMKPLLWRGLQNDLIVCAGLMIVAVGITFNVFTKSRHLAVKILGYAVWGLGILITAEALLLTGDVLLRSTARDAAPDAPYAVVISGAINADKSLPVDLTARVDTAVDWWKSHPGTTLILAGDSGADYDENAASTAKKKTNTLLSSMNKSSSVSKDSNTESGAMKTALIDRGVEETAIRMTKQSLTDETRFENLLSMTGVEADTPIVLITNNYDMNRIVGIAQDSGFTNVTRLPAPAGFWEFGTNILWQVWSEYDPVLRPAKEGEV
ncbi:MAG: YdcF family protein [Clostridia bacterium]|nr:YdcF family protein [Clostridia bacterium]